MVLPKQVLDVAASLKKTGDARFETMQALITPREIGDDWDGDMDYQDGAAYEKMWESLRKHEENVRGKITTNEWVFSFLDDVIAAQRLPRYFYIDIEKRLNLIVKLNNLTRDLSNLYIENSSASCTSLNLNQALRREESRNFEKYPLFAGLNVDDISGTDMAEVLKYYTKFLINNISSAETLTKDSEGVEERMFSFSLVKRNEFLYKKPLHQVVSTAKWALYGVNNAPGTIANIVRRSQEL